MFISVCILFLLIFYIIANAGVFKDDKRTEKTTHADPVSLAIGEFGRWQALLTLILSLLNLPCTWHIYVLTFQGADTDFWCAPPPGVLQRISVDQWKNLSGVFPALTPTKVKLKEIQNKSKQHNIREFLIKMCYLGFL